MYLFIFALVLRLGYMVLMLSQLTSEEVLYQCPDARAYINISRGMLGLGPFDEDALLIFGPGYGAFLAVVFFLFGVVPHAVILIQILLSSISCMLIYKLGRELTGSRAVGLVAGILAAVSFTSISLANVILSDCPFFFLFLLGNLLFLLGLKRAKQPYFISSGICIGFAALTRSVGQLWPLVMIILIFILPPGREEKWRFKRRFNLFRKAFITPLIAIVLMSGWMARNYHQHRLPIVAFAGPDGIGKLTAFTQARLQESDFGEIYSGWVEEYRRKHTIDEITFGDRYDIYLQQARRTFCKYPWEMLSTYLSLIWGNVIDVNELYRGQLPKFSPAISDWMNRLKGRSFHLLGFWSTMAGFIGMMLLKKWRALSFPGLIYFYFALIAGFGCWQGSRLFYPAQIAWAIVIAFLLVNLFLYVRRMSGSSSLHRI
jgi:4-amino-4-deoxy-L-arabinose transferase-like glycosyltransferase